MPTASRWTPEEGKRFAWLARQLRLKGELEEYVKQALSQQPFLGGSPDAWNLPVGKRKPTWTENEVESAEYWIAKVREIRRLFRSAAAYERKKLKGQPTDETRVRRSPFKDVLEAERERAKAESLLLAYEVSQLAVVRIFRDGALGNQVLTDADATTFIEDLRVSDGLRGRIAWEQVFSVDDPMAWWDGAEDPGAWVTSGSPHAADDWLATAFVAGPPVAGLQLGHRPSSAPDELRDISDALRWLTEELATRTGWSRAQSCRFALTGRAPFVAPVIIEERLNLYTDPPMLRVVVDAQPWVSLETITRAYKATVINRKRPDDRQLHDALQDVSSPTARSGRRTRGSAVSARKWRVYQYVFPRREGVTPPPTFAGLYQSWREAHPEDAPSLPDWKRFQRAYNQTKERLGEVRLQEL